MTDQQGDTSPVIRRCEHDNAPDVCPACEVNALRKALTMARTSASDWHAEADRLERQLAGAVSDFERVGKLAAWIIRDRRESDKVTAYAGELEALARRHGGQSTAVEPPGASSGTFDEARFRQYRGEHAFPPHPGTTRERSDGQ